MKNVVVIGGGIIGLSSAFYLQRAGHKVTVLDKDGAIAAQVGDNPNEKQRANFGLAQDQWKDGICNSPHGASIDKDGNLIVSEWSQFGHLHKFNRAR